MFLPPIIECYSITEKKGTSISLPMTIKGDAPARIALRIVKAADQSDVLFTLLSFNSNNKSVSIPTNILDINTVYQAQLATTSLESATEEVFEQAADSARSVWSHSFLIKPVNISNFTFTVDSENDKLKVEGSLILGAYEEDYLISYQVFVSNDNKVIYTSEDLFPIAKNSFSEVLNFSTINQNNLLIKIAYETKKGYVGEAELTFPSAATFATISPPTLSITEDGIRIRGTSGYQVIRKAANEQWYVVGTLVNGEYVDNCAEAGVLATYALKNESSISDPATIYLHLDDIHLQADGKTLRIKYNPDASGLKFVNSESMVQTLGAKYPIFRTNARLNYRQFTIKGLLSFNAEEEINSDFLTIVNPSGTYYEQNAYKERNYRDAVIEFLNTPTVKLFRSTQEGNYLVRLTNIQLMPNTQLARNIYTFSALATEVDEANYDNYKKHNII